ncbi:MAG: hypothetical protein ACLFSB_16140, partial [Chitinispirillaceae bacterium]
MAFFFVVSGVCFLEAIGKTYPVSSTGSFKDALTAVLPGDSILVEQGLYVDEQANWHRAFNPNHSGTAEKPIVIRSRTLHGAILKSRDKTVPALGIQSRKHIVMEGFRVRGAIGVKEHADSCVIRYCDVTDGFIQGGDISLHWGIYISFNSIGCVVEHNHVHDMAHIGNRRHNGACIMIHHGSQKTLIQHNEADGGDYMYAAYGQKGGDTNHNLYRYNIARNCESAFFGTGSTDRTRLSRHNKYVNNVAVNCHSFLSVAHDCRAFAVHHNTAWRVHTFFYGGYHSGKKGNSNFIFRYNIADTL